MDDMSKLVSDIRACRLCAQRFAETATGHAPNPVARFSVRSKILIAGQAPGLRVHKSGKHFTDPSGDRLRNWMGVDEQQFYDLDRVSILPMAFCFPGYDVRNADLPPPKICAETWRDQVLAALERVELTLLVGTHAQAWHLGGKVPLGERVRLNPHGAGNVFCLPHPSWRNNAWLKKNSWFETDTLPRLREAVRAAIR